MSIVLQFLPSIRLSDAARGKASSRKVSHVCASASASDASSMIWPDTAVSWYAMVAASSKSAIANAPPSETLVRAGSKRHYLHDDMRPAGHARQVGGLASHHLGSPARTAQHSFVKDHPQLGRVLPVQDLLPRQPGGDRLVYLVFGRADARGQHRTGVVLGCNSPGTTTVRRTGAAVPGLPYRARQRTSRDKRGASASRREFVELSQRPVAAELTDALARLGQVFGGRPCPRFDLADLRPDTNTRAPSCSGVIPARVL